MRKNKTNHLNNVWKRLSNPLRWLVPGLGVKRWIVLILLGTTLLGVGLAVLILEVYRTAPETWWLPILSIASLRVFKPPTKGIDLWWIGYWIGGGWNLGD